MFKIELVGEIVLFRKISIVMFAAIFMFLSSCGEGETQRPIDYSDAKWSSEVAHMEFTVIDGEIKSGTIIDKNGQLIDIVIIFSDIAEKKITVEFADKNELIFEGSCSFEIDSFKVSVTDVYSPDFEHLPIILTFTKYEI